MPSQHNDTGLTQLVEKVKEFGAYARTLDPVSGDIYYRSAAAIIEEHYNGAVIHLGNIVLSFEYDTGSKLTMDHIASEGMPFESTVAINFDDIPGDRNDYEAKLRTLCEILQKTEIKSGYQVAIDALKINLEFAYLGTIRSVSQN
jgi:hypothetical protein